MKNETAQKIVPSLWFDNNGEEAIQFYLSVFKDSKMGDVLRYGEGAPLPAGTLLVGSFWINGQEFSVLNGGPMFTFTEAVSFVINCENQAETDYYWNTLTANGGQEQACGWLKDKYGLSWQVVPMQLIQLMKDPDAEKAGRVMQAMMQMKKIDIAKLEAAYNG